MNLSDCLSAEEQALAIAPRLDLGIKYKFAKQTALYGSTTHTCRQEYALHLKVWNNYQEDNKSGVEDFISAYRSLINDQIVSKPVLPPVLVSRAGQLVNGIHRLASSLLFSDRPLSVQIIDSPYSYDQKFFQQYVNKSTLESFSQQLISSLALSLVEALPLRCLVLFPSALALDSGQYADQTIKNRLSVYSHISRTIPSKLFPLMLLHFYCGQDWAVATKNYSSLYSEALKEKCKRVQSLFQLGHCTFYFVKDASDIDQVKADIRSFYKLENDTIHSTDTINETRIILGFLKSLNYLKTYSKYFSQSGNLIRHLSLNSLNILPATIDPSRLSYFIGGSAVLDLFGLRDANDIDFVELPPSNEKMTEEQKWHLFQSLPTIPGFSSHHSCRQFYPLHQQQLDESASFYLFGHRILKHNLVRQFKLTRGESKDIADVKLLTTLLG